VNERGLSRASSFHGWAVARGRTQARSAAQAGPLEVICHAPVACLVDLSRGRVRQVKVFDEGVSDSAHVLDQNGAPAPEDQAARARAIAENHFWPAWQLPQGHDPTSDPAPDPWLEVQYSAPVVCSVDLDREQIIRVVVLDLGLSGPGLVLDENQQAVVGKRASRARVIASNAPWPTWQIA
jgi:hypothetical protein